MKTLNWLDNNIEAIADELAEKEFCIIDNFVEDPHLERLLEAMSLHRERDNFQKAGIGNSFNFHINKGIRGDRIKWIEKENARPETLHFLRRIEELMADLNRTLFLSLKDYECHFAIYPSGTFYEKHLDQFKISSNRKISFAFYLNKSWEKTDGGELRLYRANKYIDVAPLSGRIVIFRSDTVEHEVLETRADRYSITGWMLDRPVDVPFL